MLLAKTSCVTMKFLLCVVLAWFVMSSVPHAESHLWHPKEALIHIQHRRATHLQIHRAMPTSVTCAKSSASQDLGLHGSAGRGPENLGRTTGKDHWEVGSGIGSGHRQVRGSVLGSGHPSGSFAVPPETEFLVRAARGGQIGQLCGRAEIAQLRLSQGHACYTHVHA